MNRRGFLGAFTAAVAGTAATALPSVADAPAVPTRSIIRMSKGRNPAYLEWRLPDDFTLDDVQKCLDHVAAIDRRFVIVSAEFGSPEFRRRYLSLITEAYGAGLEQPPIYLNEALGPRGFRAEVELRRA